MRGTRVRSRSVTRALRQEYSEALGRPPRIGKSGDDEGRPAPRRTAGRPAPAACTHPPLRGAGNAPGGPATFVRQSGERKTGPVAPAQKMPFWPLVRRPSVPNLLGGVSRAVSHPQRGVILRRFLAALAKLVPKRLRRFFGLRFADAGPAERAGYLVWAAMGIVIGVPEIWAAISGDGFYWPTISTTVGHLQDRWPVLTLIPVALIVGYGYSALRLRPAATALQADLSAVTRTPQGRLTAKRPQPRGARRGRADPRSVSVLLDAILRRRHTAHHRRSPRRIPEPQPVPRRLCPLQPDRDLLGHRPQHRRVLVQT